MSSTLPIPDIALFEEEENEYVDGLGSYQMRQLSDQDQDDQPSTSGVAAIASTNEPIDHDDDGQSAPKKTKKEEAIEDFIEKVSIAGLPETHRARFGPEKLMWHLSLSLACAGILYTSYAIIEQRLEETNTYDDKIANVQAPFPNITVCAPQSVIEEKIRKLLKIPDKIVKFVRQHGVNEEEIVRYSIEMDSIKHDNPSNTSMAVAYAAEKAVEATLNSLPLGYIDFVRAVYATCKMTFSDCYYNGQSFECCEIAGDVEQLGNTPCYQLNVEKLDRTLKSSKQPDLHNLPKLGLEMKVHARRNSLTFTHEITEDGFRIQVGKTISDFSDPIDIPTGMDATIVLKAATKVLEKSQCRRNDQLIRLDFYPYYDPAGDHCRLNSFLRYVQVWIGCYVPMFSFSPGNATVCGLTALKVLTLALNDDVIVSNLELQQKIVSTGLHRALNNETCQPLCSRWEYPVFSTSYSSIFTKDQNHSVQGTGDWTRVRVYFGYDSHWIHKETPVSQAYLALCDIGGIFGVYLGFSMITFIEMLAYGLLILIALPGVQDLLGRLRQDGGNG